MTTIHFALAFRIPILGVIVLEGIDVKFMDSIITVYKV